MTIVQSMASAPEEKRSWVTWIFDRLRFLYFVWRQSVKDRCLQMASSLSFQTLFSLVPLFALSLILVNALGEFSGAGQQVQALLVRQFGVNKIRLDSGSDGVSVSLADKIDELINNVHNNISLQGINVVGFLILVFVATTLMSTTEHCLNGIYNAPRVRPWPRRLFVYWSVLTLGPVLIGLSIYLNGLAMEQFQALISPGVLGWMQTAILPWLGASLMLFLIYYLMPNTRVDVRPAIVGALVAALFWKLAEYLFGVYVLHMVGEDKIYGNLGLIPLFFFWVWIFWVLVLFGAELSYTLQHLSTLDRESRQRHVSRFVQPDLLAVAIVVEAGQRFHRAKPPLTLADILDFSIGEQEDVEKVVGVLVEERVLHATREIPASYMLARPLADIRVADVIRAVAERTLVPPDVTGPAASAFEQITRQSIDARVAAAGTTTFADLCPVAPKAATGD